MQTNPVIVIDFGAQYAQLIARRVREAKIFSIIMPHTATAKEILEKKPAAIIFSGGPKDVTKKESPKIPQEILESNVPILGICYGFQAIAYCLGGKVENLGENGEFGYTKVSINKKVLINKGKSSQNNALSANSNNLASHLFKDIQSTELKVWMSHRVQVVDSPKDFIKVAKSTCSKVAAFENHKRRIYGVQWHPEVVHSENGQKVLENFLYIGAKLKPNWTVKSIIEDQITQIQKQVGKNEIAICGLSGGVDSAVAAAIVQKAIGNRLTCVFVDHGLLRSGEKEQVEQDFVKSTGAKLITANAKERFLNKLKGVVEPEKKRKIIGTQFIREFEEQTKSIEKTHGKPVKYLVQGTLYPDIVESGGGSGTATIKSHHNVGGLPKDMQFSLIEPLKDLFKDEVRAVGLSLGLPKDIIQRQPFPGPGLAIRIIGQVNKSNLSILSKADAIVRQELEPYNQEIWQCPVVLLPSVRSVGVQGDERTYGHPVILRPVESQDAMTADWFYLPKEVLTRISTRITNEVKEINRVVLDITQKPPGTIEWE